MKYLFQPPSNAARYLDEKWLRKKYKNAALAEGMMALFGYLDNAMNAFDLKANPAYYFHPLTQNRKGLYSLAPLGKGKPYRLLVACLDETGHECVTDGDDKAFLLGIKQLEIKELTNHYDEP